MQILPNGQVQITNNQTGETRTVDPTQLASFSPFLANQYYAYMTQQKALDKGKGAAGTGTDVLQAPDGTPPPPSTNQSTPDLSGLAKFAKPLQQKQQAPQIIISGLTGNNPMGTQLTPMTQPVQQQPQKPQQPQGLSTFDISKANF